MDEYMRVLEFVKPDPIGASFDTDPETLSFSWSGVDGRSLASDIAEKVAEHFTDIIFHICWHCIDTDDFTFGVTENGVIKRLEMSREEQLRLLDEVRDSILEDNSEDLPF